MILKNFVTVDIPQVFNSRLTVVELEQLAQLAAQKYPQFAEREIYLSHQKTSVRINLSELPRSLCDLVISELPRISAVAPFEELEIDGYEEEEEGEEYIYVFFSPKKSWVLAQLEAAL